MFAAEFSRVTPARPMLMTAGFSMGGVFCSHPALVWVMALLRVLASSSL